MDAESRLAGNDRFPGSEWETLAPEQVGLDPHALDAASRRVFEVERRYGFLVVRHGAVVYESYARTPQATCPIFSVTKSFAAALFGAARARGWVHETQCVREWLPVHHADIAPDAELRHILSMTAGTTPAGTRFAYNSSEILNSLPGILWLASGRSPHQLYRELLQEPMQLSFDWPHNERGWCQIGSQGPLPVIQATHRDVARLGLLWLRGGVWAGKQLVERDFVAASLKPTFPEANAAYGYLWWLNTAEGTWRMPQGAHGTGSWLRNAPSNVYLAMGALGKLMYVVPDHDLVVVTLGKTLGDQAGPFVAHIWDAIASCLPH